jgi:hypothetical protein
MKKVYEKPSCEQLEFSVEGVFCTSGEKTYVVSGYSWDDDDE